MLMIKSKPLPIYRVSLLKSQLYRALNAYLTKALQPYNISPADWQLVGVLSEGETFQPTEIARLMDVKPPVITATLRRLAKQGLIKKVRVVEDSRFLSVSLTAKGRRVVKAAEAAIQEDFKRFTKGMKKSDIKTYFKVLNQLNERIGNS